MSGIGTPELDPQELTELSHISRQRELSVAIIASQWHATVMNGLISGAERFLDEIGLSHRKLVRAPGSFELPVLSAHAAKTYDAVIALGVVIRGGTPHFDYVCNAATDGLCRVTTDTGTPVGFGLLTCDTEEQALQRAGLDAVTLGSDEGSSEDKGYEAAHAAVAAAVEIASLEA